MFIRIIFQDGTSEDVPPVLFESCRRKKPVKKWDKLEGNLDCKFKIVNLVETKKTKSN